VHLYSILRHRDGRIIDRLELDLPAGSRVGDVLTRLAIGPDVEPVLALNGEIAGEEAALDDGDHLAIIPAVAGG
jgi:sulfur carrier protein ThiS